MLGDGVVGGLGGSVRDPGIGSIDTPSVTVGVGTVEDVGVGTAVGEGTIGTVRTGGGAWAVEVGISKNPCTINKTIALKQLKNRAIDRLDRRGVRGFPGKRRFLSRAVLKDATLKDATVRCSTFSYFLRLSSIRAPKLPCTHKSVGSGYDS